MAKVDLLPPRDDPDDFPVPKDGEAPEAPKAAGPLRDAKGHFLPKPGGSQRSSTPSPKPTAPKAPASQKAALADVRTSIAEAAGKGGAMMMTVAPLTGGYLVGTADQLADAVTRLAANNPSLLRTLQRSSVAMDYVALASWGAGFVVAAMCEAGRMPVDTPVAQRLGVTDVYWQLVDSGAIAPDDGSRDEIEPDPDAREVPVPDALGGGQIPASA